MDHRLSIALALLLALLSSPLADASEYGDGNARVRLVTSVERAEAGGSFLLGVHFDIRPGWHIYWRNPGGAGLATDVQWRLPEAFVAGPIQWPLPVYFTQSGDIPGYGYVDSVVLASEISVPQDVGENNPVALGAKVSWLACKDVCVIGDAVLEESLTTLPVDRNFATWSADLPRSTDGSQAPFTLTTRGGLADGKIELWLQWREAPRLVEWFPDPPDSLEVDDVKVRTRGSLTRVDAVVRTMAGTNEVPNILNSLVVMSDENGRRRGWELAVDLKKTEH
jgi:hypothetical protein